MKRYPRRFPIAAQDCDHSDNHVTDSRYDPERGWTRRRRRCLECGERWSTYEVHEQEWRRLINLEGACRAIAANLAEELSKGSD